MSPHRQPLFRDSQLLVARYSHTVAFSVENEKSLFLLCIKHVNKTSKNRYLNMYGVPRLKPITSFNLLLFRVLPISRQFAAPVRGWFRLIGQATRGLVRDSRAVWKLRNWI